jgi:hypothetical protein
MYMIRRKHLERNCFSLSFSWCSQLIMLKEANHLRPTVDSQDDSMEKSVSQLDDATRISSQDHLNAYQSLPALLLIAGKRCLFGECSQSVGNCESPAVCRISCKTSA